MCAYFVRFIVRLEFKFFYENVVVVVVVVVVLLNPNVYMKYLKSLLSFI